MRIGTSADETAKGEFLEDNHLYDRLIAVYTQENLTTITASLIAAYRERNYLFLDGLARSIRESVQIHESRINKLFTRLIMLYHPDRVEFYRNEIGKNRRMENLDRFSHIFAALDFVGRPNPAEGSASSVQTERSTSRREDFDAETFAVRRYSETLEEEIRDFMSALKQEEYGNLEVVYGEGDLMNIEGGLELSGYNIHDLSGLELCVNLTALDLSRNAIVDIAGIGNLHLLEELDLSFNRISQIHSLSELKYLARLDLSFNDIDDIRPLCDLDGMEYVNLVANPVPKHQAEALRKKGVIVII